MRRTRTGIPAEHSWQAAVVQYLEDGVGKLSLDYDKAHFQKLDPYLRGYRLRNLSMSALRPFIRDRKQKDGVANGTINRALETVRHVLNVARDERDQSARADGIGWLEVVRDGAAVCTFSAGAFISGGGTN